MYIRNLKLKNFRNYDELNISFENGVNMVLGENAQGKTNLIEAIYMTGFARSFRTSKDVEVINFNEKEAYISAEVENEDYDFNLEMKITGEGKFIKCDGKKINRMVDLLSKVYVVVFSPEDLRLVKDLPEKRRKFIDQELSKLKPAYYESLYNYKKALKQRNTYLKENRIDMAILDIWDYELVRHGQDIIAKRADFIEKLEKISSEIHSSITSGKEVLTLEYEANVTSENFIEKLKSHEEKDIQLRTTSVGPHRDDIKICVNGIDIRHFGSQGQQRTAALSLKLAEIKLIREITGENAILLLDDVLSELDINRQAYLINSLDDVQMFITATDISPEVMERLKEGKIYNVSAGKVNE